MDESLKYWERGEALAKACEAHLDGASKRVEEALRKNAEGTDSAAHNEETGED